MSDWYEISEISFVSKLQQTSLLAAELRLVQVSFGKMPTLTGNGDGIVKVNSAGTALETEVADLSQIATNASNIATNTSSIATNTANIATNASNISTLQTRSPTLGTPQATTSGTAIDFTSIPSWVTKIVISFVGVSTSGTSRLTVQIGDSGGIETSGYSSAAASYSGATLVNSTVGFSEAASAAGLDRHGLCILTKENSSSNTWCCSFNYARTDAANGQHGAGSKSLSAALDRVRITTVGGADTLDAGEINILYE